jgi:protoporphyrinogen oxidase
MSDEELGREVCADLERAGLPAPANVEHVRTRRVRFAYPIYGAGFEQAFQTVDRWLSSLEGFLTFRRQGLFAHDNTHQALAMSYAAVECIDEAGTFDTTRWAMWRRVFETYIVED